MIKISQIKKRTHQRKKINKKVKKVLRNLRRQNP